MMNFKRTLVAMVALLTFVGATNLDENAQDRVYTIVSDTSFAPFEFLDAETNTYIGVDMEIMAAVAADQGFEYIMDNCGWNAALGNINSGQADGMIAGMTITEERLESYDFSNPYFEDGQVMFVAENSAITSLEDLEGKIVAVKTGTQSAAYAQSIMEEYGFTVQSFEGSDAVYASVQTGNVDAGIEDYSVISYRIQTSELPLQLLGEAVNLGPYGFAVLKGKNAELIEMFNAGLANIRENGVYDEILAKYGM